MVAIALSKCVMVITHMNHSYLLEFTHLARSLLDSLPQMLFDNLCRYIGEERNIIHQSYWQNMHGENDGHAVWLVGKPNDAVKEETVGGLPDFARHNVDWLTPPSRLDIRL